jgi:hypothetical protein
VKVMLKKHMSHTLVVEFFMGFNNGGLDEML